MRPVENPFTIVGEVVRDADQVPRAIGQYNDFTRVPVSADLQEGGAAEFLDWFMLQDRDSHDIRWGYVSLGRF